MPHLEHRYLHVHVCLQTTECAKIWPMPYTLDYIHMMYDIGLFTAHDYRMSYGYYSTMVCCCCYLGLV